LRLTEYQNLMSNVLARLDPDLATEMKKRSVVQEIPKGAVLLREGQYVKVIPLVLSGLIKVFTSHEDKELLLYYIRPDESCIMSFSASLKNEPSRVIAIAEEDTKALLLPVDSVAGWTREYPAINHLFFQQYNLRYSELLDTIHHVLFDKMDKRLYDYLKEKVQVTGQNPLSISHRQIANELGTAREVVSRTMKKLENSDLVKQHNSGIELLQW